MKIAICLSGHLRSFLQTFASFKSNILDQIDCDIFIHTFDKIGFSRGVDGLMYNKPTSQFLNKITRLYQPKKLIIESSQKNGEKYRRFLVDNRNPNGIITMFHKIESCTNLALDYATNNYFTYDAIIRCRPDLLFSSKININDLNNLPDKTIYLPITGHYSGCNDQFAFGNSSSMKTYSSVYSNLDNLCHKTKFIQEHLLKSHLEENNLDIRYTDINYCILRCNGQKFING